MSLGSLCVLGVSLATRRRFWVVTSVRSIGGIFSPISSSRACCTSATWRTSLGDLASWALLGAWAVRAKPNSCNYLLINLHRNSTDLHTAPPEPGPWVLAGGILDLTPPEPFELFAKPKTETCFLHLFPRLNVGKLGVTTEE